MAATLPDSSSSTSVIGSLGFDNPTHSNCLVSIRIRTLSTIVPLDAEVADTKCELILPAIADADKKESTKRRRMDSPIESKEEKKVSDSSWSSRESSLWRHVYVASVILAVKSEHFRDRFEAKIKDPCSDSRFAHHLTLEVAHEEEAQAILDMLRFCYSTKLPSDISAAKLFLLCELADLYHIPSLETAAIEHLHSKLLGDDTARKEVIATFLAGPYAFPCSRLSTSAMAKLVTAIEDTIATPYRDFNKALSGSNIYQLSLAEFGAMLNSSTLSVDSENTVWFAICEWIGYQKTNGTVMPLSFIVALLRRVRLRLCSRNFLLNVVLPFLTQLKILSGSNEKTVQQWSHYIASLQTYLMMGEERQSYLCKPTTPRAPFHSVYPLCIVTERTAWYVDPKPFRFKGYQLRVILRVDKGKINCGFEVMRPLINGHQEYQPGDSLFIPFAFRVYGYSIDFKHRMELGRTASPFKGSERINTIVVNTPDASIWKHTDYPHLVTADGSTTFHLDIDRFDT